MISKCCKYFWALGTIIGLCVLANVASRQFRLGNITGESPNTKSVIFLNKDQEALIHRILEQPFTYLDRGKQSFAFASKDGQYVLKFFDFGAIKLAAPLPFPKKNGLKKLSRLFNGYRNAYEKDLDHTGILFLQLSPNPFLKHTANVIDRFGWHHIISLNEMPFVIQFKAIPTRLVIAKLLEKGDVAAAKHYLGLIIDMYLSEYQRGLYDRDHNFMYNTGFVENVPIRIDAGRLRYDERYKNPDFYLKDLKKVSLNRVEGWLQRHFPQYRADIMSEMQRKIQEIEKG